MKHIMDTVNAGLLFTVIALIAGGALIAAAFMYIMFFYLRPYDKPKRQALKRGRSLFCATRPAQTRISDTLTIFDPHPDAHGEVTRAVYPKTAGIRDLQEPMGV